MAADCQSSSQIGDISKYNYMDLITPTEHEVRISLHNSKDGLVVLASKLQHKTKAKKYFYYAWPRWFFYTYKSKSEKY